MTLRFGLTASQDCSGQGPDENEVSPLEDDTLMAVELASLLLVSSPGRALPYAVAMHEIACEEGDLFWQDLWRAVVEELRGGGCS